MKDPKMNWHAEGAAPLAMGLGKGRGFRDWGLVAKVRPAFAHESDLRCAVNAWTR